VALGHDPVEVTKLELIEAVQKFVAEVNRGSIPAPEFDAAC